MMHFTTVFSHQCWFLNQKLFVHPLKRGQMFSNRVSPRRACQMHFQRKYSTLPHPRVTHNGRRSPYGRGSLFHLLSGERKLSPRTELLVRQLTEELGIKEPS